MVATQPSDVLACGSGQEHFGRVLHEPVDLPTPLDGTVPTGLSSSIRCCMMLSERSLGFGMASRRVRGHRVSRCTASDRGTRRAVGVVEWLHLPGKVRDLIRLPRPMGLPRPLLDVLGLAFT